MVLLIVILCICPLFLNPIDDAGAHIARIEYLADNIQNLGILGQLNAKVYFGMVRDAGYGYPMFYGDILLYPFAIILAISNKIRGITLAGADGVINQYNLYKLFLTCQFIAIFVNAYIAAKKFFKHHMQQTELPYNADINDIQFLIGFLYLMMPYTVAILHNQAYRVAAIAILPWVIYNAFEIYLQVDRRQVRRNVIWLQITMTLVIMTHVISAVYISVILVIFIAYEVVKNSSINIKAIERYVVAALVTVLLSSALVLPMLIALKSGVYAVSNTQYDLAGQYNTSLFGTFIPEWLYVIIAQLCGTPENEMAHYGQIGYYGFYYTMLMVYGIRHILSGMINDGTDSTLRADRKYENLRLGIACLVYQIVYFTVMGTGFAQSLIEFTQFRYRLNTIFDCGLIYLIIKMVLFNLDAEVKADDSLQEVKKHDGLEDSKEDIENFHKLRMKILNILVVLGYTTVLFQVFYSQMLDIGRGELGIQVGGGGEYLVYNEVFNNFDTDDQGALHYGTQDQIIDMTSYIDYFKGLKSINVADTENEIDTRKYEIDNVRETIKDLNKFTKDTESLRAVKQDKEFETLQTMSENSLVLPIIYYPGYEISIYQDGKDARVIQVGYVQRDDKQNKFKDNEFKISDYGFIQIDLNDSELNSSKLVISTRYTGTWIDLLTFQISQMAWLVVIWAVIVVELQIRKEKMQSQKAIKHDE